jgi:hypothetical protein
MVASSFYAMKNMIMILWHVDPLLGKDREIVA